MSKKLAQLRRSPRPTRSSARDKAEEQTTKRSEAHKEAGISGAKSTETDTSHEARNAETNGNWTETTKPEAAIKTSEAANAPSPLRRQQHVKNIIAKYAAYSSAASLLPIPIADVVGITATQVSMVAELSRYYGVPFSKNFIRSILAAIAGGTAPWTATVGIVSLCKGMPGFGLGASLVSMVGLSNFATRILGNLFVYHFENGGDLSNIDTDKMQQTFQAELKNG